MAGNADTVRSNSPERRETVHGERKTERSPQSNLVRAALRCELLFCFAKQLRLRETHVFDKQKRTRHALLLFFRHKTWPFRCFTDLHDHLRQIGGHAPTYQETQASRIRRGSFVSGNYLKKRSTYRFVWRRNTLTKNTVDCQTRTSILLLERFPHVFPTQFAAKHRKQRENSERIAFFVGKPRLAPTILFFIETKAYYSATIIWHTNIHKKRQFLFVNTTIPNNNSNFLPTNFFEGENKCKWKLVLYAFFTNLT